jgi:hypothetical protein
MIQFARQNAMTAAMTRQKHDVASTEFSGKKIVGWRAEGSINFEPFLIREAFDMIQSAAADDADAMI